MVNDALDDLNALKRASVFIRSPDNSTGSGYLIAPGVAGTANHVVKNWSEGATYEVLVGYGPTRKAAKARLLERDEKADAAVIAIDGVADVAPLPVAAPLRRRAPWEGYGFPAVTIKGDKPEGLSLSGHVQDPTHFDNEQAVVVLYSDAIAAGQASPLHGFSGSPVLVDGALVGHLIRHIGDPEDRKRAAFGYAFACPIDKVTALLDKPPATQAIEPPPLPTVREAAAAAALGAGEYHVFVSYRSTDRPWALKLVERLEGAGLKVFFDQKELEAGQYLGGQLSDALARSRTAVLLVTRGWLESKWCQQEAEVLVQRAVEHPDKFALVPLRLEAAAQMPPLLNSRLWLDFAGSAQPEGPTLQKLVDTLLHRSGVGAETPQAKAAAAEREVTDKFVTQVRAAAKISAGEVDEVLVEWRKISSDDAAPLIAAADALIGKGWPARALQLLAEAPASLRVRQLTALGKRKDGRLADALQDLEALEREGQRDAETLGLLAGTYKALWQNNGDAGFRQRAYETHRQAYERFNDAFNGINAAALALYCGDEGTMHEIAGRLITTLNDQADKLDAWGLASLGEAYLLKKRLDQARDWYGKAVAASAGRHQDIAVMRRQARRNLEALGLPRNELDATLPVPRVLAYTGHRVDADGRDPPRFPESKVPAVKKAIAKTLQGLGNLHGFGGAASGTDLLVLKDLVGRGLTATVVLPFPEDDFLRESVGDGWRKPYSEVRAKKTMVEFAAPLSDVTPAREKLPAAFGASNEEVQRRALAYAKALDEDPVVLAVWDGKKGDGPGGTADAVRLWRMEGVEPIVIDPTAL
jgi:tetratricopeptide (TPR) repeat protein